MGENWDTVGGVSSPPLLAVGCGDGAWGIPRSRFSGTSSRLHDAQGSITSRSPTTHPKPLFITLGGPKGP